MNVEVETMVEDEGSIILFRGVEEESRDNVLFAADHRPGHDLAEALYEQGPGLLADVPEWAVLSRTAAQSAPEAP